MVIMGDCRAKVLSREVGEYTGIYVPFSNRRRDVLVHRQKQQPRHETRTKLARGVGLTRLVDYQESWQQAGQSLKDLDAEARMYFDAWKSGALVDDYRKEPFDRFSHANRPLAPKFRDGANVPALQRTSPEPPEESGARPIIIPPPHDDIPPPVSIVSNDPAPENRNNPRANNAPPVFVSNPPIKPELESATPSPVSLSPAFDTARGDSLGRSVTPPPGINVSLPEHAQERVPPPQIAQACPIPQTPLRMKGEVYRGPSEAVEIHGGRQVAQEPTEAIVQEVEGIDLTGSVAKKVRFFPFSKGVSSVTVVPRKEETTQVGQDNSLYILMGLVFVGLAVWFGDDRANQSAIMPYY